MPISKIIFGLYVLITFFIISHLSVFSVIFPCVISLIYGRIVEKDEILNFVQTINLNRWEEQWLREDLENVDKSENVLNKIPEKIDLLLLDGGEFSTYSEWLKLKDRSTIIMLDDTTVTKCKKINDELKSSENYTLIFETLEGHGFSVFKKIND